MAHKRNTGSNATASASASASASGVSTIVTGDSLLESLPETILNEILLKLEPETPTTLCSLSCVSTTLHSSVNKLLSSSPSLDLSAYSLDSRTFDQIVRRFGKIQKITLDCLILNDSSIRNLLGPHVEELVLLKCSSLSFKLLSSIGRICYNLRVLTLEFSGVINKQEIIYLNESSFKACLYLESLKIIFRGGEVDDYEYTLLGVYILLPKSVKVLKLDPVSETASHIFLKTLIHYTNMRVLVTPMTSGQALTHISGQALTHISLVLDVITDVLLSTIARDLPQLVELDLKDRPTYEPSQHYDLSDLGLQSLVGSSHLTSLSLVRSRKYIATTFKRATDMGMFLLSEGCKGLQSVRLGGFSKVSDAGFTSILNSCLKLKKFEIQNAFHLTDLSFQDVSKGPRSLVEVKLISCNSITSEAVRELATCSSIEILDLLGCRSVADSCLSNVSRLSLLTSLNLGGADVTDYGMASLGKGNAPVTYLSLRGCKRVNDKGIALLLESEGKIRKTLSSLDLGYMSGITDNAITFIADACTGLTELCIRNCFYVTDASVKALALRGRLEGERKLLRRLDLCNCTALSSESFEYLKKPLFRGLHWIGIGGTRMFCGDAGLAEVYNERRWLFICADGCEVGCHDGWQFH